ncbi:MAG: hypothetical protein K2I20_00665, partial [Clostridia bacterium]|nr:hypothetical protein [Clostridia bacterium]
LAYRSSRFNFECGAAFSGEMCGAALRDFNESLTLSHPLKEERLLPHARFYRFILKLFAPLM